MARGGDSRGAGFHVVAFLDGSEAGAGFFGVRRRNENATATAVVSHHGMSPIVPYTVRPRSQAMSAACACCLKVSVWVTTRPFGSMIALTPLFVERTK